MGMQMRGSSLRARALATLAVIALFALMQAGAARAGESVCIGYPALFEFVQQPSDTLAAAPIQPDVTVLVKDDCGEPLPGVDVEVAIWDGTNLDAALGGTTTQTTDGAGVATFDDLEVDLPGTYTLQAYESFGELRASLELVGAFSDEFEIGLELAVGQLDGSDFGDIADVEKGDAFPVTVRTVDADGTPIELPDGMLIDVTLAPFTCLGDPCGASLGGDTTEEIAEGESEVTFSVSYPLPQNFLALQATATGASEDPFTVDPGESNDFNVYDALTTQSFAPGTTFATDCTDTTPLNPVCVTATFLSGAGGTASALEASCVDGTEAACLGAIAGLVGDLANRTWRLRVELDKSISGQRGVAGFVWTYAIDLAGTEVAIKTCKKNGKPNPGEKICLDAAHRDGSGDSVFTFVGVGDPFLKGK
jgi:hypothetical protein